LAVSAYKEIISLEHLFPATSHRNTKNVVSPAAQICNHFAIKALPNKPQFTEHNYASC